jgi:hypothetical protein
MTQQHQHQHRYHVAVMRNVGAVAAGLLVGASVNMALILLNFKWFFPLPADVTFNDTERFAEYIATQLPATAFAVVFAAHYGQAVVGGYLAAALGTVSSSRMLAQIVAVLTMAGSIVNNLSMRQQIPAWTWIEIPWYPVVGWLVGTHVERLRTTPQKGTTTTKKKE